ncbi:exodeoxyribonuclease 7 small subunit [Iodidimonas gelatinilytica]|uniref:Exodeoxyribonuclease 7 small subunit n=2 Tax=Iodidimonas TaxID=2066486 RepID=A0A5A7MSW8_9PROT|nr:MULTISPECIES: exodeoxyribonuclease VII small subunit [Iodidimonas]GEQ98065.1 exodeoxyribonuclease 7 small subunit [Iodidimonas gelatinilytica]GEQ99814.1 exodeoxyribonuclease 7 small subunit [Iodidimonas gelatinilytica]GER08018.1 exodeoxyribonuclease 7 small subunit [Kordiimonadales bacterium JCM 17843]GGO09151.1 exodeoxyribonuclease 7 small subunit [Iodidimonas muriae]
MAENNDQIPDDIKALTFEDALKALEDIVGQLESGAVSLEDSINIYTRGTWLKRHCEAKLKRAEARIEKITLDVSGDAGLEAFDVK